MLIPKPLILFIDAYDSFSNNIISLLETTLDASVRTIQIDNPTLSSDAALHRELRHYAAVVCGPGPGHPENDRDVGIMRRIWRLADEHTVPVLGVCLGFQSLCLEFGGKVRRLKGPQHGIIRRIKHVGEDRETVEKGPFEGVGEINATLYQSLCVDIGQDTNLKECWQISKWEATSKCPDLLPLAWVEHDLAEENNSGIMDERVLIAVRHRTKPFWALQYHPESICTNKESSKVIQNWFDLARAWNGKYRPTQISLEAPTEGRLAKRESLLSQIPKRMGTIVTTGIARSSKNVCHSRSISIAAHVSVQHIIEAVLNMQEDQIILESSNATEKFSGGADVRGRYSIIGLDISNCTKVQYTAGRDTISIISPRQDNPKPNIHTVSASEYGGIWPYLAHNLEQNEVRDGNMESPFWGGYMGYTTYELGLETIGVKPDAEERQRDRPDLCLAWVNKSLVVDHFRNQIYIQQLASADGTTRIDTWMDDMTKRLEATFLPVESYDPFTVTLSNLPSTITNFPASKRPFLNSITNAISSPTIPSTVISIRRPNDDIYESKVLACQSSIRAGDSYELCLTDQTHVTISSPSPSGLSSTAWSLYTTLRTRQPSPFASYIRLGSLTYISASPERFLTYTPRTCSLRPMKGTVRKSPTVSTLTAATSLLSIPKERAENLMIVDLVRHDTHGVCGAGNVSVPKLMQVEEYASVYQMISVVEGTIPAPYSTEMAAHLSEGEKKEKEKGRYTGLDILSASLPPGSMTGAPKKRSCEILKEVEGKERGLYSGVVGYADVGGRGDWSVNIRCAFKWEDENKHTGQGKEEEGRETWHIGAGGAVTALSTPVGEREEMLTKLSGTLGLFR
ncbi:ADC synthase [Cadophora sp. MPI-SDFR-AT-0126]|nr:ADC synthase [Leotiomycetes sp. MPI-SDFR-AT-0126]